MGSGRARLDFARRDTGSGLIARDNVTKMGGDKRRTTRSAATPREREMKIC